jgi:hypothetical protein
MAFLFFCASLAFSSAVAFLSSVSAFFLYFLSFSLLICTSFSVSVCLGAEMRSVSFLLVVVPAHVALGE